MKKNFNKILILFIIPIITGVISGVITAKIQEINFISALAIIFKFILDFIISILMFEMPVWLILISSFCIISAIKTMLSIQNSSNNTTTLEKTQDEEKLEQYVEDVYNGIKYRWKWYEYDNELEMSNLHPICECGCDLEYSILDSYIECPDCKKEYENTVDENKAEKAFKNRYRKKLEKLKQK